MTKEKKATADHKGLCEGNLCLGFVSFLVFIFCIYLGAWEWPGTHYAASTGPKPMNLLLLMIPMHHHTRHRIVV